MYVPMYVTYIGMITDISQMIMINDYIWLDKYDQSDNIFEILITF